MIATNTMLKNVAQLSVMHEELYTYDNACNNLNSQLLNILQPFSQPQIACRQRYEAYAWNASFVNSLFHMQECEPVAAMHVCDGCLLVDAPSLPSGGSSACLGRRRAEGFLPFLKGLMGRVPFAWGSRGA